MIAVLGSCLPRVAGVVEVDWVAVVVVVSLVVVDVLQAVDVPLEAVALQAAVLQVAVEVAVDAEVVAEDVVEEVAEVVEDAEEDELTRSYSSRYGYCNRRINFELSCHAHAQPDM